MGPSPQWIRDLPELIVNKVPNIPRRLAYGRDLEILENNGNLERYFSNNNDVTFINVIDLLCNDIGCLVYFGNDARLGISSWDYGHLTPVASKFVALQMKDYFRDL